MLSPTELEMQTLVQEVLKRDWRNGEIDLANELGVSRSTIQRWATGENLPFREVIPTVIKYLKERTKVRVEGVDEGVRIRRDASVTIYDGDKLVTKVVAKIEKKQGADGGWYDCIVLKKEASTQADRLTPPT